MKAETKALLARFQTILTEENSIKGAELAKKCHLSYSKTVHIIRLMRENGVGVHTTKGGYVLSEYAKKTQDVEFLRRLNGRRTSDFIALKASEPHIKLRWNAVEDRRAMAQILMPLTASPRALSTGMRILTKEAKILQN